MNSNIAPSTVTKEDRKLLAVIQSGLPLVSHPYAEVGKRIGMSEDEVIERTLQLQQKGIIRRMGIIVHHRPLGYNANAMVVWNLPAKLVDSFGEQVSALEFVTLCYQRKPDEEMWPYNLYTMIHGKDRDSVMEKVDSLLALSPIKNIDHKVLFSSRRFKQHGARYFADNSKNGGPAPASLQSKPEPCR